MTQGGAWHGCGDHPDAVPRAEPGEPRVGRPAPQGPRRAHQIDPQAAPGGGLGLPVAEMGGQKEARAAAEDVQMRPGTEVKARRRETAGEDQRQEGPDKVKTEPETVQQRPKRPQAAARPPHDGEILPQNTRTHA